MATLNNVFKGLEILKSFITTDHNYPLGADHDILYFFGTDKVMDDETVCAMKCLSWFQEEDEYEKDNTWKIYL